jgi:hypothetical protein
VVPPTLPPKEPMSKTIIPSQMKVSLFQKSANKTKLFTSPSHFPHISQAHRKVLINSELLEFLPGKFTRKATWVVIYLLRELSEDGFGCCQGSLSYSSTSLGSRSSLLSTPFYKRRVVGSSLPFHSHTELRSFMNSSSKTGSSFRHSHSE